MTALRAEDDAPRGFVAKSEHYRVLAQLERALEQIEALGRVNRPDLVPAFMARLGMQKNRAQIIAALWANDRTSKERLFQCLYGARLEQPEIKTIDVNMCNLRHALSERGAPAGVIETLWGYGYRLTDEGRGWLAERVPELKAEGNQ